MKTKFDYVAPDVELVPMVTEGRILIASDQYGDEGKAGGPLTNTEYGDF